MYCLKPLNEDFRIKFNVTDEAVFTETLYGRCVQELTQNDESDLLSFFNYLYNVRRECFTAKSLFGSKIGDLVTQEMMKECVLEQVRNLDLSAI